MAKWLQLNPALMAHPAVAQVGNDAFAMWTRAAMWLSIYPQEGDVVPATLLKYLGMKRRWRPQVQRLIEAGLLAEAEDGYQVRRAMNICGSNRPDDSWRAFDSAGAARRSIPRTLRAAIYARDGHRCVTCGATENLSLDHIFPYSLGGEDTKENLQTMCRSCNSRKGAKV